MVANVDLRWLNLFPDSSEPVYISVILDCQRPFSGHNKRYGSLVGVGGA